jgi:nucleotide-binding universal stress UspA family protein
MVRFQETAFNDASGTLALGQGALTQRTFAGASERFHFDLEHLQGIRPLSPTLKYGQRFASVVASRPSAELSPEEQRLAPGVQRNLGLVNHHVLNPSNLRFLVLVDQDQNFRFVTGPALQLTHAAHGQLTLLRVTGLDGDLSADRRGLQKLAAELVPKEDLHVVLANRQGEITAEIINEIQSSHPDMLLLGRPASEDPAQAKRLAVLVRRIVINTGLPLFIGTKQISKISRLLVCTLGGEAGKVVVRFAARLARHIQPETVIFHALSAGADDSDHRRMDRHLRDASALFTLYNVKNQIKLVSDLPFSGILAESENHDLIVLGASSRIYRGASRERELATYLVRQSNKAVLVVPTTTD